MAIAVAFGLTWLVIFLVAADHPPPIGFVGLLPLLALASALVYWRAIVYASWKTRSQAGSTCRVLFEGALGGLAFAGLLGLLPWAGVPGAPSTMASLLVLLGVSSALGSLSAIFVYRLSGGKESDTPPSERSG